MKKLFNSDKNNKIFFYISKISFYENIYFKNISIVNKDGNMLGRVRLYTKQVGPIEHKSGLSLTH